MTSLKVRLYPTPSQEKALNETLETCRHLYNRCLEERKVTYETTGISPSKHAQQKQIPLWSKENPYLAKVHSQVLQEVVARLQKAFDAFFRRIRLGETPGYPRFKGKGRYTSFCYPQSGFALLDSSVSLSKIGVVKAVIHRRIEGKIKTCTLSRQGNKWFASFAIKCENELLEPTGETVGIDLGLDSFATYSTGEKIVNPRFYRSDEKALVKAQRRLAKLEKGTKERRRARKVVARIHERIRNRRHNFIHQETRKIVDRFDTIAVEDLNVQTMQSNPCLAKSISDAGWGMFRTVLASKAVNAGRKFVSVNPFHTSQDCSGCGTREKKALSQRTHSCHCCGLLLDRDHNAALNILALGTQCLDS